MWNDLAWFALGSVSAALFFRRHYRELYRGELRSYVAAVLRDSHAMRRLIDEQIEAQRRKETA